MICGNRHQDSYLQKIDEFIRLLRESGIDVYIERRLATYLSQNGGNALEGCKVADEPPADARAAISIGGDGTFLRTARWIGRMEIPVLGINTGHLGFLANYTLEEAPSLVEMLLTESGVVERRTVLKVEADGIPEDIFPYALNEVAILKDETASMISVNLTLDNIFLADYLADGLVISTPTGSTGYNLSTGGPIVQPTLECLCISPIAPHTLTLRPMVVSGDSHLIAHTTSRAERYRVSLDGCSFVMKAGSEVRVSKADFTVSVMRRADSDFATTLRNKLLWGRR